MKRRALTATVIGAAVLCAGFASPAVATVPPKSVPPGTAAQVAALVAASTSITTVPSSPLPTLANESHDGTDAEYPIVAHCTDRASDPCVFGKTSSSRKIVVFGDSHAYMWLPAVAAAGKALGYKVLLMWKAGCPAATVTPWFPVAFGGIPAGYDTPCVTWRTKAIANLKRIRPALVLLSSRTAGVQSGPAAYFTDPQWQAGIKTTVDALRSRATKVAIIGDIPPLHYLPEACLAAHATDVQFCSQRNPNPTSHSHEAAEKAEAKLLKIGYISTLPWVCTSTCSAVIGSFLAYLDASHLDETYVNYLDLVMTTAVKGVV